MIIGDENWWQLTIDDTVEMATGPAWMFTNIVQFFRARPMTIVNRVTNGGGITSYPPIPGPIRFTTPLTICGDVDSEGEAYTRADVGLMSNLNYLIENVFLDSGTPRTAKLWLPGVPELDRSGIIQFEDFPTDVGDSSLTIETTVSVVLPEGLDA